MEWWKCAPSSSMTPAEGAIAAERAARESYGKLVAHLARRFRDLAAAEDALSEAFAAALIAWPLDGVPANPEGWLFAAARRRLLDGVRRRQTAARAEPALLLLAEEQDKPTMIDSLANERLPDERLGLMFACAHPALEPGVRTTLMLQTVLGLSAERIAPLYLSSPATISQRLVRAKRKIRDAGIPFAVPGPEEWGERLGAVVEAIYGGFGEGWSQDGDLAEEAIWLGRVLVGLAPGDPEALGLLALMLHVEARRPARRGPGGSYVPLDEQDVGLWRRDLIAEAEGLLRRAAAYGRPGRFQIEAAIQSAHAVRLVGQPVNWRAVAGLYQALAVMTGSPVAALNQAAALARFEGPGAGLSALEPLADSLGDYQPYWALKAHLLAEAGERAGALEAYDEAIAREADPAVQTFLQKKRDEAAGDVEG